MATLVRFIATGATTSVSYGLLFLLMGTCTNAPDLMINLVATIFSTVAGSELHRRFTFRAAGRGSIVRGQGTGIVMAGIGLLANSFVLAGWNLLVPGAGNVSTLAVVYCVNGAVGLANFLILGRVLTDRAAAGRSGPGVHDRLTAPRLAAL